MVYVVSANDSRSLKNLADLTWIYIGGYHGLGRVRGILNENKRKFIGKDIERITNSVRENFVNYIGKISQLQKDKLLWHSSSIASKSAGPTSIFSLYVYMKLLEELSSRYEKFLVVTDDEELICNARKMDFAQVVGSNNYVFLKRQVCNSLKGHLKFFKYFILWLMFIPLKNREVGRYDVIIHSWLDERVFLGLPKFTDSYTVDLENFLMNKGYKVGRLVPLLFNVKYIFKLQKCFTDIIYPMSYLAFPDLIKTCFTKFDAAINKNMDTDINDVKILNVLAENEAKRGNSTKNYLANLVMFYSYKNLSALVNRDVTVIYPFENQCWEKMLNLAFSEIKRVAYQHSVVPSNMLSYRLSKYEKEAPSPGVILSAGREWSDFLKKDYNSSTIEVAGAIRFSHLFDKKQRSGRSEHNSSKDIIVALPQSSSISISLQKLLLNSLGKTDLTDYVIKIKPHPYLSNSAQLKNAFSEHENCRFTNGNAKELFKNCILFITSNSAMVFESVLSGIKTFYYVPEETSLGQENFIREHLIIAYEEDFLEKLKGALQDIKKAQPDIEKYFSFPDYNVFLKYLKE